MKTFNKNNGKIMENYNEKINYGSELEPMLRDRLAISTGTYGFNLFDKKEKKYLLFAKEKCFCEEGKTLLLTSKFHFFESFKERIQFNEVVTNKILIDTNKDGEDYYSIPTLKDLYKVSLYILNYRFDNGYFVKYEYGPPKELDYTEEDIEKMPESFRKEAKTKLDNNKSHNKNCKKCDDEYSIVEKAINEKDGELAFDIIKKNHQEYEDIKIVEPRKI